MIEEVRTLMSTKSVTFSLEGITGLDVKDKADDRSPREFELF